MTQLINELVKKLIQLGEDETELNFWLKIYPDLELEEQDKLIKNLEKELEQLEKIKK